MVRVASCPKCSHEAVMFDETLSDDWARCPECRTYFQIKNASAREIPQLVMTQDEALLVEEESEAAKETVCSALETRWDTRRTMNAASLQTIAGIDAPTSAEQNGPAELSHAEALPQPTESAKQRASRTVADFSSLATWSELPQNEIEAQARAERAGDTPVDASTPDEAPKLPEQNASDPQGEPEVSGGLPQPPSDAGDRVDKWFQSKKTIVDFPPLTSDEAETDEGGGSDESSNKSAAWADSEQMEQSDVDVESPCEDESSSDDEEPESADADDDRAESRGMRPPGVSPARPAPSWARPRRRSSPLRTFVMSGIGGIFGLALGYYALLWISGPSGDFLQIAEYLPNAVLPAEFRSPLGRPTAGSTTRETEPSAEIQASYTAPVQSELSSRIEKNENGAAAETGDTDSAEPAPFDASGAVPAAGQTTGGEPAGVAGAPSFTADELAVALRAAQDAQPGLVTGDLDGSIEVKRAKGLSYAVFCDLAQKAAFVDTASRAEYVAALTKEATELFRTTLADAHTREEVARIVPMWIESAHRKHGGVFFAGQVSQEVRQGPVVEWQIDLGHESIPVLADASKAFVNPSARPVVILGWIVDKPAEQVTGYTGQAQQAVWAGHIISLE